MSSHFEPGAAGKDSEINKQNLKTLKSDVEANNMGSSTDGSTGEKVYDHDVDSVEEIHERRLSWYSTAALLLTEYVVLAILAFPSSFAVLGMAGGTIATLLVGLATLYTSHVLWRYCMAHRQIRDICDASFLLFGNSKLAWWAAFIGLALNNYAIMGLHVNAGATAIQTIRNGTECTLLWGGVIAIMMFAGSLMRDFRHLSVLGLLASGTMFICTLLVLIGHGIQGVPNNFIAGTPVTTTIWAPEGTTFVQGLNAVLNITYTWVGQALIPSFVGDMKNPEDFPKALYLSMAAEFILFTITGAVVYHYAGTQYAVAPAYGSLIEKYGKAAAGLTLPTIVIVGILYSLVTSRAIFFQFFSEGSVHRRRHTVKGWSIWFGVVLVGWIISYLLGTAVPFFNNLLSLISAFFDSWFGFIFWGLAWFRLNKGSYRSQKIEYALNVLILITGFFLFVAGTYTSIQSILDSYASGPLKHPFSCVNTGFTFSR